jgi:hypothetical protein
VLGVAGVAALKDDFQAAEQLRAGPGVLHATVLDLDLDAQVALKAVHRVDDDLAVIIADGSHRHFTRFTTSHDFLLNGCSCLLLVVQR